MLLSVFGLVEKEKTGKLYFTQGTQIGNLRPSLNAFKAEQVVALFRFGFTLHIFQAYSTLISLRCGGWGQK